MLAKTQIDAYSKAPRVTMDTVTEYDQEPFQIRCDQRAMAYLYGECLVEGSEVKGLIGVVWVAHERSPFRLVHTVCPLSISCQATHPSPFP